jgi:predicted glycosyltransferase involved in capsule biosynthesis
MTNDFLKNIPLVSVIVTCKNRLEHLKQTLPRLCMQKSIEIIVVDYGCLQGTKEWVKNTFHNVKLVFVDDDPIFSLSRARNIGAAYSQGEYLMFSDADIFIEYPIHEWVMNNFKMGEFYTVNPKNDPSLCGTAIINKRDFQKIGGYDEVFRGWGGEDLELYERLKINSVHHKYIDDQKFSAIQHSDNMRLLALEQGGAGSKKKALMTSKLYTKTITDFHKKNVYLNLNKRLALMNNVKKFIDSKLI